MDVLLAYSATALMFLGQGCLAFDFGLLGWLSRLGSDILWLYWANNTRPLGWKAVILGEGVLLIIDSIGFSRWTLN